MSAVFGFYYNGKLKITYHPGEGNPIVLGYDLVKTLYYSWPQEIMYMFNVMTLANPLDKPTEAQLEQLNLQIGFDAEKGWNFQKPKNELTFQEIFSELSSDTFRYFTLIRHSGLGYMLDGFSTIKTWGIAEWAYIYNLNESKIEVWHLKETEPTQQELYFEDDRDRLNENYELIHAMIHDQNDLGRNQFDLSGMDYAYSLVY